MIQPLVWSSIVNGTGHHYGQQGTSSTLLEVGDSSPCLFRMSALALFVFLHDQTCNIVAGSHECARAWVGYNVRLLILKVNVRGLPTIDYGEL
jgi:hypothetical protein